MPPKKKLAIYLRVSSEQQREDETIENQMRYFKEFLGRMGLFAGTHPAYELYPFDALSHSAENPSFFIDDGYNIESPNPRTRFHDLLQQVSAGLIDTVAVYHMNRIFRSQDEVFRAQIVKTFRQAGATFWVNGVERNPSDLASLVEQHSSAMGKTDNLRNCHRGKVRRCETEGAPPSGHHKFGFRWLSHRLDRRWEPVPRDLQTVRWIGCLSAGISDPMLPASFRQILTERPTGISDQEIADLLWQQGIQMKDHLHECRLIHVLKRNPEGRLRPKFIQRLLQDRTYVGEIQYRLMKADEIRPDSLRQVTGEKKVIGCSVTPVFSHEEWDLLQQRRTERSSYARRNVIKEYLLKDLLTCACCGKPLAARQGPSRKKGRPIARENRSWYYTCTRKQKAHETGRCPNSACHNGRTLEPLIWKQVCQFLQSPAQVAQLQPQDREHQRSELDLLERALVDEKAKVEPLAEKLNRINSLIVDGVLNLQEGVVQKKRINDLIDANEKEQSKLRSLIRKKRAQIKERPVVDVAGIRRQIGDRIQTLTFDERRSVIRAVVDQIRITEDRRVDLQFRAFA